MLKFQLILLAITGASSIAVKRPHHYKENFHAVAGYDDTITFIKQINCTSTTVCNGEINKQKCLKECQDTLNLNIDDFSRIAPNAFRSNFGTLRLGSEGPENCPERKAVILTEDSFRDLSSVRVLQLDCIKIKAEKNPFKKLRTIKQLDLSRVKLSKSILSAFPELNGLRVSGVKIETVTPKNFSGVTQELRELSLVNNNLTVIEPNSFKQFNNLRKLEISRNNLTDLKRDMFNGLKEVTHLDLRGNNIKVLRRNAFAEMPKLAYLDLSNNPIREIETGAFSGVPLGYLNLTQIGMLFREPKASWGLVRRRVKVDHDEFNDGSDEEWEEESDEDSDEEWDCELDDESDEESDEEWDKKLSDEWTRISNYFYTAISDYY